MQAPGIWPPEARFETVAPAAFEASAAVTSVQASTFEIVVALGVGVGEGVAADFEDDGDDPQATIRPHIATAAIRPPTA
jgi:hypothetical protein